MSTAVADVVSAPEPAPPRERVRRRRLTSYILPVFTGVMILYLASPVFLMILYGFNVLPGERQSARFDCCTLTWWSQMLAIPELNEALRRSIAVAIPAALIATVLGAMIGLVLGRYRFSGRPVLNFVIFLAIAIPEIVLGSALLSMFVQVNEWGPVGFTFSLGYQTILISHVGFSVAFVAITVRARVQGLDRSMENAAQDLYAPPAVAFWRVTMPLILPGIVAGFLLAFVLSLDDFVITSFVAGSDNTFPTWVYGTARRGIPPQVNVWGTVLFLAGVATAGINLAAAFRKGRQDR